MNKAELIHLIAEETGLTKAKIELVLNAFMKIVMFQVAQGVKVLLVGFGSFEARDRKERPGRNPQTNESIIIPATKVPYFSPGKMFKDEVLGVAKSEL